MTRPAEAVPAPDAPHAAPSTRRIYDAIYGAILEHRLAPGTRLREEELAESFAVSRTVVRQALHRLAQDRVVELQHHRGATVPQPGPSEAAHVFDARRVVECEVARRLAGQLDAAALARLAAVVQAETEAYERGDRSAAIRHSGEFHRELARLAGNPLFVRMLDELLPTTSLLLALYQRPGRPACVAHRHQELIAVLRAGTGASAAAEMRRHLREIEQSVSGPQQTPPAPALRDLFAAYREA
ncbi:GntR family transcriptional regulator [Aquincola tertiaricarbonis]|uniref:GntR family transcriptional regulator n=1 Tax=Aquincola tertiaricarbonis TaxID=391953 RepID=A0ABY4SC00_AQUTE|nr:GntR family transcriptional regulator [Aquincola tertiaricarbonis]URI09617.1 GntR family transcriptional regulator [Aquincola tertiaricarbonis]